MTTEPQAELLTRLAQDSQDAIAIIHESGLIRWANKAFARWAHRTDAQLQAADALALIPGLHALDREQARQAARAGRAHRNLVSDATKLSDSLSLLSLEPARDGSALVAMLRISAVPAAALPELLGTGLVDLSSDMIVATNTAGTITTFNRTAERLTGRTSAEVIGALTPLCYHQPDELDAMAAHLSALSGIAVPPDPQIFLRYEEQLHDRPAPWTICHVDGRKIRVMLSLRPLRGADGVKSGVLGMAHDLRTTQARERLERVSDLLPATVFQLTRHPDGHLTCPFIGAGARDIFGLTPTALVSDASPLLLRIHPEDRPRLRQDMDTSARTMRPWTMAYQVVCPGEPTRWIHGEANPHADDGGAISWHGYISDVTEARQQRAQLAEALARAEEASDAKSQFLARMSHEIRTPMNGIIGMGELLLAGRLTAPQRSQLKTALDSAEHLLAVINDLLDFSAIDAGQTLVARSAVSLGPLLAELTASAAARATVHRNTLLCTLDPSLPATMQTDGRRLHQILHGLLDNALKFTSDGVVTLEARLGPTGRQVEFFVTDTGMGIPDHAKERIFQPFEQVDRSRSRPFDGTGLGLAISHRLAQLLGGDLTMTSKEGVGSSFRVELPLVVARPTPSTPAPALPKDPPLRGARLLVAEDNPTNQLLIRAILRKLGAEVVLAADGEEALDLLQQQPFDLLLADLHMPRRDGLELARAVRALEARSDQGRLPIVALTADATHGTSEHCIEAGMDAYLTKPVRLNELIQTLTPLLRREPTQPVRRSSA